jgi:hypothetical protein
MRIRAKIPIKVAGISPPNSPTIKLKNSKNSPNHCIFAHPASDEKEEINRPKNRSYQLGNTGCNIHLFKELGKGTFQKEVLKKLGSVSKAES